MGSWDFTNDFPMGFLNGSGMVQSVVILLGTKFLTMKHRDLNDLNGHGGDLMRLNPTKI